MLLTFIERRPLRAALALLFVVTGCVGPGASTELEPLDADTLCDKLSECGLSVNDCESTYSILRVTSDCADTLAEATCEDFGAPESKVDRTCFPACPSDQNRCNGDGTLSRCMAVTGPLQTFVIDCEALCKSGQIAGTTKWTGVCGKTYQGQVATRDTCWCE